MIKKNIFKIVVICFFILFAGCSKKIVRHEYDENLRGYKVFLDRACKEQKKEGIVIRDEDKKKVTDEEEIEKMAKKYNSENYDLKYVDYMKFNSETRSYKAAKKYYNGLKEYNAGNYEEAIKLFNIAVEDNPDLKLHSDIHYLLGKSYIGAGEKEKAVESFETFIQYSDRIIPESFYLDYEDEGHKKIGELFSDAEKEIENIKAGQESDLGIKHHLDDVSPRIYHRPYHPGFTMGRPNARFVVLGYFYSSSGDSGVLGGIHYGLLNKLDCSTSLLYSDSSIAGRVGLPLQVYKTGNRMLGIRFTPYYIYTKQKEIEDVEVNHNLSNFAGEMSVGYYLTPQFSIYSGCKYYYYNENNKLKINEYPHHYEYWLENRYYVGLVYYIFRDIGFGIRYGNEGFVISYNLAFGRIGYNIKDEEFNINLGDLGFDL